MTIVHNHYPSVAALRAEAAEPFKLQHHADKWQSVLNGADNPDWFGVRNAAAVATAITEGYPEGEREVRTFRDAMTATLPRALGHNRVKVRGAFGDELDVHAMNRGAFDRAWTSSARRVRAGSGVLRLVVDIAANGGTSASALRWRGIAGLALAEVMGKAGYSVEIVAAFTVKNMTEYSGSKNQLSMMFSCVVKPRMTQADYGLLAATVALPGFFRTLGFQSIIRAADNAGRPVASGFGQYLDVSGVLPVPDRVTQLFVPQSVVSHSTAVKWVKQSITLLQGSHA